MKTEKLHQLFQGLQEYSFYTWDFMGLPLFQTDDMVPASKILANTSQKITQLWLEIYQEALDFYEDIWAQTEPKLKTLSHEFERQWIPVQEPILTKMSSIAKLPWKTDCVNVHLVDCIFGGSAWTKDVALSPFPNIDVEKKLLAHELAHTLAPDYFLKTRLQKLGLDWDIAHTVVDLIAYFSVKEHVIEPEKRGIKPNPDYYAHVTELYPLFEECYNHPEKYQSLDRVLEQIKLQTKDRLPRVVRLQRYETLRQTQVMIPDPVYWYRKWDRYDSNATLSANSAVNLCVRGIPLQLLLRSLLRPRQLLLLQHLLLLQLLPLGDKPHLTKL